MDSMPHRRRSTRISAADRRRLREATEAARLRCNIILTDDDGPELLGSIVARLINHLGLDKCEDIAPVEVGVS